MTLTDLTAPAAPAAPAAPRDAAALRLRGIAKRYDGFELGPLDLDVPRGSIVGLIGRNGAGKTTLMHCALGAVLPSAGSVELFGQDLAACNDAQLAALRARVGSVSSVPGWPPTITVADVSRMYEIAFAGFSAERFAEVARRLELDLGEVGDIHARRRDGLLGRKVKELSRGMGMKVQLAAALACDAELLLLDEPTAGLDPIVRDEVLDVLREYLEDEQRSVLISSHITSDLEQLVDRLVLIDGGRVLLECPRDAIDEMGVARLRSSELNEVLASALLPKGEARFLRRDLSVDLLVPDRAAFSAAFPALACDPAGIDDVMTLLVKGERR